VACTVVHQNATESVSVCCVLCYVELLIYLITCVSCVTLVDKAKQVVWKVICLCFVLYQPGGGAVTQVKLKETIDHVLAVGSSSGDVLIFQLPVGIAQKSKQVICQEVSVGF